MLLQLACITGHEMPTGQFRRSEAEDEVRTRTALVAVYTALDGGGGWRTTAQAGIAMHRIVPGTASIVHRIVWWSL